VNSFNSHCGPISLISLPEFSDTRIMMMPVIVGDVESIPASLRKWESSIAVLFACDVVHTPSRSNQGKVGYLTIDEKEVMAGETHRRAGMHVDGGSGKGWGGGGWGSRSTGMLTTSNVVGCRAWVQSFEGEPGDEGNCEHLRSQLKESSEVVFNPYYVYWVDGLCVHESIPQPIPVRRQFVRLSLPSDAPWYDGYTSNPLGVKPTGPILPRREFMDAV
jgi:hypothetical protein